MCQVPSAEAAMNNTDKYPCLWEVYMLLVYFRNGEEEKKGVDNKESAQPKYETCQVVPNTRENISGERDQQGAVQA